MRSDQPGDKFNRKSFPQKTISNPVEESARVYSGFSVKTIFLEGSSCMANSLLFILEEFIQ